MDVVVWAEVVCGSVLARHGAQERRSSGPVGQGVGRGRQGRLGAMVGRILLVFGVFRVPFVGQNGKSRTGAGGRVSDVVLVV